MTDPIPASPLWGDHHEHPGCFGCQICFECLLDDGVACPGCAAVESARESHDPAFLAAFDAVTLHLGAPSEVKRLASFPVSFATWERDGDTWEMDNAEMGVLLAVMRDGRVVREASVDPPDLAASAAAAVAHCREALS